MTEGTKHVIQQCGYGSLAIGACHANQFEFSCRVAIEECGHLTHYLFCRRHGHIAHAFGLLVGHCLKQYGGSPLLYGLGYICMSVHLCALDGHKEMTLLYLS